MNLIFLYQIVQWYIWLLLEWEVLIIIGSLYFKYVLGLITATATNPVWLIKTRLQLHQGPLKLSICFKRIYNKEGLRGFYRVYLFIQFYFEF